MRKFRVITVFPPYRNSFSNLEKQGLQELLRKKIRIFRAHFSFCFPRMFLNIIASPQHLDHRKGFRSQLTNLIINNRNWLFFARQALITSTLWGYNTCEGSEIYFLSIEIWNTGCTWDIFGGKANRYATMPILSSISKGPMYLGANFSFLPNLITPFIGDTFKTHSHQPKILHLCTSDPHRSSIY